MTWWMRWTVCVAACAALCFSVAAQEEESGGGESAPAAQADEEAERAAAEAERQAAQARVRQAADEAIDFVRSQPPVHEREEPWTVPVSELALELQPLRAEQVAERLEAWLGILQPQVRLRIRMDIAIKNTEDDALKAELVRRSDRQQEIVSAIVDRIEVLIRAAQLRGVDVEQAQKYVANSTGQEIDLTDPVVLWQRAQGWLVSPTGGVEVGLNILKAVGVMLAFWILAAILGTITTAAVKRLPRASSLLQRFLVGGVTRLTLIVGAVVAIGMLGVNITPLVAAIGAAGLVIGLALQGTLSNFASGILILIYRPYDIGHVIEGGGVFGKVEAMSLVTTTILTFDNKVMYVPNNEIWNNVITNYNGRPTRRVDLTFGINYKADIGRALEVIEDVVMSHPKTLDSPAPTFKVNSLGDNSVNLIARPWCHGSDYWDIYWDCMRAVKERLDAEGIGIPFPQRDLHVPGPIEVKMVPGD